jgi:hypothetical protein
VRERGEHKPSPRSLKLALTCRLMWMQGHCFKKKPTPALKKGDF